MIAYKLSALLAVALGDTAPVLPVARAAADDFGFVSAMLNAGLGEQLVMAVLVACSVASWGVIFYKYRSLRVALGQSEQFLESFWGTKRLDAIYQRSEQLSHSPLSQVFRAGYVELAKLRKRNEAGEAHGHEEMQMGDLESVERSMKRASLTELTELESWVPFLATAGATAPFIGLFGTVIGIVNAFGDIGASGNANLATVAPSIGGALVATAFGLFAAIPAVVAYNYFVARLRTLETEMQSFAADFLNIIKRHFC